jgi:hypothetical protein
MTKMLMMTIPDEFTECSWLGFRPVRRFVASRIDDYQHLLDHVHDFVYVDEDDE